ncbi:4Fe-4S binding protein [candidate division WOR-3 bacterium]|jgi:2-oxoacid:acceptor oxidoreductase delta subunit (pyruvate/2-ketoisovalerate family)|nr:4Fe-4S binding protein [candidate division WOR-3 bacterium]
MEHSKKKIVIKGASDMPDMVASLGSMASNKTGSWRNLKPIIDESKCIKCFICWKFCPDASIDIVDENTPPKINYDYCKGCGVCAEECPVNCISMIEEE